MWLYYRRAILDVFGQSLSAPEADAMVRAFKKVIAGLPSGMSASGTKRTYQVAPSCFSR